MESKNIASGSSGKVALVTGGSSGLGFAIAGKLISDGYNVIITGRDADKLENARTELGDKCSAHNVDVSDFQALPGLVDQIAEKYGRIDVLVNNAGINMKKPMSDVTDEDFQRIISVNTSGVFALTREVVRYMKDQDSKGVIINISSMAAQYGLPYVIAYTASKTAIDGMTRALAVELGPLGIRVNAIAPGFIRTPMSSKALDNDPARRDKVLGRTPLGRLGEPEDVANAVSFLVSDQAKFINGVILMVDGGNSIGF
jgi:NAD(P)-dependent dehydrogenase (short-subunit alcohol dehydrogenase family)